MHAETGQEGEDKKEASSTIYYTTIQSIDLTAVRIGCVNQSASRSRPEAVNQIQKPEAKAHTRPSCARPFFSRLSSICSNVPHSNLASHCPLCTLATLTARKRHTTSTASTHPRPTGRPVLHSDSLRTATRHTQEACRRTRYVLAR